LFSTDGRSPMVTKEPFDSSAPKPHPPLDEQRRAQGFHVRDHLLPRTPALDEQRRVEGFHALLATYQKSNWLFHDADGASRPWRDLSPEGRLDYIAGGAVSHDVPFERFAEAVRDALGDQPPAAREEAAGRLLFSQRRELHDLARLAPDDERATTYTPLIDRFREVIHWYEQKLTEYEQKLTDLAPHAKLAAAFKDMLADIADMTGPRRSPPAPPAAAARLFGDGAGGPAQQPHRREDRNDAGMHCPLPDRGGREI
jgi:hypothetical protein